MRPALPLFTLLPLLALAGACANHPTTPAEVASSAEINERHPALPEDWGGANASRWRPEAVIANVASQALNDAWRDPATRDVIVAVPTNMLGSDLYPYGDGQSNAAPSFNNWPTKERPPVIATLIDRGDQGSVIRIRLDRTLPTTATIAKLRAPGQQTIDLALTIDSSGDRIGELTTSATTAFFTRNAFAVIPDGWRAGFAISFAHPTKKVSDLPARITQLLDREQVRATTATATTSTPTDTRLRSHVFTERYNNQAPGSTIVPYTNTDVHARFPMNGRLVTTAVGGGRTWVADARIDGYKTMYQCFDARDRSAEASAANDQGQGGVASGTGWHAVGDRAETIVNDVEKTPMLVGFAQRDIIMNGNDIGPDGYAWNLNAVATIRLLMPNEALITPRGTLHWFAFSSESQASCAEILVSPETERSGDGLF
jgi:hypothetical protein